MKIGYSILREIEKKNFIPTGPDYGITDVDFDNLIKLLENKVYIERVLRVGDKYEYSIKNARLTKDGLLFLEQNEHYEESYPDRNQLKSWIKTDRYNGNTTPSKHKNSLTSVHYDVLLERIKAIQLTIEKSGGKVTEFIHNPPATIDQVSHIEKLLKHELPASFKKVLLEFSSKFSFKWFFDEGVELPNEFREIFSGRIHWDLNALIHLKEDVEGWIDNVFPDIENEYDLVWHNKLAFCDVGNGDFLAFDLNHSDDSPIIYLNHEGGEGHGYIMATNFTELLDSWSRIAFVGEEDSQWLPFTESLESRLVPDGEAAERFRALLSLTI